MATDIVIKQFAKLSELEAYLDTNGINRADVLDIEFAVNLGMWVLFHV
ncbi:MAG TPA: hypothetical protein VMX57_00995 [Planctomycetota bacterium]|nr:hypothetical protein [Planctomycetota bacterium]